MLGLASLAQPAWAEEPPHASLIAGESGGRADMRWLALSDPAAGGAGLAVAAAAAADSSSTGVTGSGGAEGAAALQMNVSRFSVESFDKARHDHELEVSVYKTGGVLAVLPAASVWRSCDTACHDHELEVSVGGGPCALVLLLTGERVWVSFDKAHHGRELEVSGDQTRVFFMLCVRPGSFTDWLQEGCGSAERVACCPPRRTPAALAPHPHPPRPTLCLQASDFWHVHLDCAHMGLGGDDSWSPTGEHTCSRAELRWPCCGQ